VQDFIASISGEYDRYKKLADDSLAQLSEQELSAELPGHANTVAITTWHIAGNLKSRFTDFLTTDGEKPWRDRNQEFAKRAPSRAELTAQWEGGWATLRQALSELSDEQLAQAVTIRGKELSIQAALHRSLAHTSYHVGQIVQLAKAIRAAEWKNLSIPPGESAAYNKNPKLG